MRTLSRKRAHRKSLIRNLATSLILYESLETTLAKAKEVKGFVDVILSRSKDNDLNSLKYLSSILFDNNAIKKISDELIPRYAERNSGGYVRILKTGNRLGDNAPTAIVELVDKKTFIEKSDKKPEKSASNKKKVK